MTKTEKLAWCAGFFDGEGCISLAKFKQKGRGSSGRLYERYQLSVIVAQRDRKPLDVFAFLFGGTLRPTKANNGSTYWYYRLHNQKALALLEALLPFLISKQSGAELGIAFQRYLNDTLPLRRSVARASEENEMLDCMCETMTGLNKRNKLMDYTAQAVQ